jgi:hypothetical protein
MTELYEILKAIKGVRVSDPIAAMMGRSLSGGYSVCESESSVTIGHDTAKVRTAETDSLMNKWVSGYDYILRNTDIQYVTDTPKGRINIPIPAMLFPADDKTNHQGTSLCRQKPRESG